MRFLLRARPSNRSVTSATPTSRPPPSSLSRSRPSAAASLLKPPLDFPLVSVAVAVGAFSRTTGLGWALSGRGPPTVASSAAPLKQCPPSPTSPQVQDPTLDMAMIQTGAPPYEELPRMWSVQEKEEEKEHEEEEAAKRLESVMGW